MNFQLSVSVLHPRSVLYLSGDSSTEKRMSLDTTELSTADDLFVGMASRQHDYYKANNITTISAGKSQMYDAMESLILNSVPGTTRLRFMSLPGKFWRFELRLWMAYKKRFDKAVDFTGFERDQNVILSGAGYVPRSGNKHHGFRKMNALRVDYFKTNAARWIGMDVNHALDLNNGLFSEPELPKYEMAELGVKNAMEWWIKKFCQWDAVWLDYYGPVSERISTALTSLHWHCRPSAESIPVGVTVLKGREFSDMKVSNRKRWLEQRLGGACSTEFKTVDYFEYNDGGSVMCNITGLILRPRL